MNRTHPHQFCIRHPCRTYKYPAQSSSRGQASDPIQPRLFLETAMFVYNKNQGKNRDTRRPTLEARGMGLPTLIVAALVIGMVMLLGATGLRTPTAPASPAEMAGD